MLKISVGDQSWQMEKDAMTVKEAKAVERFTGVRMSQIDQASDFDNTIILVWMARRRHGEPDLQLEDVDFKIVDVSVVDEDDPTDQPLEGDPVPPTDQTVESPPAG